MTSIRPTRPGSVDRLLTIQQAAAYLNVPARTLGEKARLREVPFTRIFKHIRFTPADIAEIIAKGCQGSHPAGYGTRPRLLRLDPVTRQGRPWRLPAKHGTTMRLLRISRATRSSDPASVGQEP